MNDPLDINIEAGSKPIPAQVWAVVASDTREIWGIGPDEEDAWVAVGQGQRAWFFETLGEAEAALAEARKQRSGAGIHSYFRQRADAEKARNKSG